MKWALIKDLLAWLFRSPVPPVIEQEPEPLICGDNDDKELNEMSGTWLFIKDWALSEIKTARKKNDASLDVEKTAALRGEIRALKRLANLPNILTSRDNRLKYNAATDGAGGEDDE